jgi:hypothetical protein
MSNLHKVVFATAALLCAPTIASAAYSSASDLAAAGALDSSYLTKSIIQVQQADPIVVARAQAVDKTPSAAPLGNLPGKADLLIWNFSTLVRAHQGRQSFQLIDREINTAQLSEGAAAVSAVPLPGVVWLFVMSVMGLAGTRMTGIKRASESKTDHAVGDGQRAFLPFGTATPA